MMLPSSEIRRKALLLPLLGPTTRSNLGRRAVAATVCNIFELSPAVPKKDRVDFSALSVVRFSWIPNFLYFVTFPWLPLTLVVTYQNRLFLVPIETGKRPAAAVQPDELVRGGAVPGKPVLPFFSSNHQAKIPGKKPVLIYSLFYKLLCDHHSVSCTLCGPRRKLSLS